MKEPDKFNTPQIELGTPEQRAKLRILLEAGCCSNSWSSLFARVQKLTRRYNMIIEIRPGTAIIVTALVISAFIVGVRIGYARGVNDGGWDATNKCMAIFAPTHKGKHK
jgi:hypothetical protein